MATIRQAEATDAPRLLAIRRHAILQLALPAVSPSEVRAWAHKRDLGWMQTRIASDRVQVAVVAASSAGWIATCDGSVLGLYVDPQFAGRGVGSELLRAGEAAIRAEGLNTVELEASANAESFYSQRGYQVSGQRLANGALPMLKHLS